MGFDRERDPADHGGPNDIAPTVVHKDPDVAIRIEERDAQRLAFLMQRLKEIGFFHEEARVRGQLYQAIMTGEFLRSGDFRWTNDLQSTRVPPALVDQFGWLSPATYLTIRWRIETGIPKSYYEERVFLARFVT